MQMCYKFDIQCPICFYIIIACGDENADVFATVRPG